MQAYHKLAWRGGHPPAKVHKGISPATGVEQLFETEISPCRQRLTPVRFNLFFGANCLEGELCGVRNADAITPSGPNFANCVSRRWPVPASVAEPNHALCQGKTFTGPDSCSAAEI